MPLYSELETKNETKSDISLQSDPQVHTGKFLSSLEKLKMQQPEDYQLVILNWAIIFKYLLIDMERKRYPASSDPSLEILEKILERDRLVKQAIYRSTVNLDEAFKALNNNLIVDMQTIFNRTEIIRTSLHFIFSKSQFNEPLLKKNVNSIVSLINEYSGTLLQYVQNLQKKEYQKLKKWENETQKKLANAKKNWLALFKFKSKKSLKFLYLNSLFGLSIELIYFLLSPFSQKILNALKVIAKKVRNPTSAGGLTHSATRVSTWLQPDHIFLASGVGLGIVAHYFLGGYGFLRLVCTSSLSQLIYQTLHKSSINDEKAVVEPSKLSLEISRILQGVNLLTSLLEFIYWQDFSLLLGSIGGSIGSSFALRLSKKLKIPNENQAVAFLFISMVGHELGTTLILSAHNRFEIIIQKGKDIRDLHVFFKNLMQNDHSLDDFNIETSNLYSPLSWFHNKQLVKIEWRNHRNGFFSRLECEMTHLPNTEVPQRLLTCSPVMVLPPRLH